MVWALGIAAALPQYRVIFMRRVIAIAVAGAGLGRLLLLLSAGFLHAGAAPGAGPARIDARREPTPHLARSGLQDPLLGQRTRARCRLHRDLRDAASSSRPRFRSRSSAVPGDFDTARLDLDRAQPGVRGAASSATPPPKARKRGQAPQGRRGPAAPLPHRPPPPAAARGPLTATRPTVVPLHAAGSSSLESAITLAGLRCHGGPLE